MTIMSVAFKNSPKLWNLLLQIMKKKDFIWM